MVNLKVYNLIGPNSLTKREVNILVRACRGRFRRELGIKLTHSYSEEVDPFPDVPTRPEKYFKVFQYIKAKGHLPNEVNVVLLGPWMINGLKTTTGGSSGVGMLGKDDCTAIVSCQAEKYNLPLGYLSLLHELGHIFGASHTDSGIMHPNPATQPDYEKLRFSDISIMQIKGFMNSHEG